MEPRPQEPQTFQNGAGHRQAHTDFLCDFCQTTSYSKGREVETPLHTTRAHTMYAQIQVLCV